MRRFNIKVLPVAVAAAMLLSGGNTATADTVVKHTGPLKWETNEGEFKLQVGGRTMVDAAVYDEDNGNESGSAHVFTRSGTAWTQQAKLTPSDGEFADYFGISVAVDDDTAVIGAYADDDNGRNSGSAYVFHNVSD